MSISTFKNVLIFISVLFFVLGVVTNGKGELIKFLATIQILSFGLAMMMIYNRADISYIGKCFLTLSVFGVLPYSAVVLLENTIYEKYLEAIFFTTWTIGFLFIVFLLWRSQILEKVYNQHTLGIIIICTSYELIIYSLCDYFFREKIDDTFNSHLFRILNLIGLALILFCFGLKFIKQNKK
jgi:hypothetical protein